MIAINRHSSKLNIYGVEMPNAPYSNTLSSVEYQDIPGNKSHSKEHLNQEKLDAQYAVDKLQWVSDYYW